MSECQLRTDWKEFESELPKPPDLHEEEKANLSCLAHSRGPKNICIKSPQSCLTLCDPMDCSPQGFSVLGILQARVLQWVAILSSRGSSQPRDGTCVSCDWQVGSLPLVPPGKPRGPQLVTQIGLDNKYVLFSLQRVYKSWDFLPIFENWEFFHISIFLASFEKFIDLVMVGHGFYRLVCIGRKLSCSLPS